MTRISSNSTRKLFLYRSIIYPDERRCTSHVHVHHCMHLVRMLKFWRIVIIYVVKSKDFLKIFFLLAAINLYFRFQGRNYLLSRSGWWHSFWRFCPIEIKGRNRSMRYSWYRASLIEEVEEIIWFLLDGAFSDCLASSF